MTDIKPLGDRAFLVTFEDSAHAARWALAARAAAVPGITDVVPAFHRVGVFCDPAVTRMKAFRTFLETIAPGTAEAATARHHAIPVLYDGEDLDAVAAHLGLDAEQVVAAHSGSTYHVQAMGFLPGYPYAGPLPEALRGLARRESPRVRVPAGSVAIAGSQTGIYPQESPGGWHLLGRTPLRIVELASAHFPIRVGDRVRFQPIEADEFRARQGELL